MIVLGIDIGSRSIKAALLKDGQLLDYKILECGFQPHLQALEMIKEYQPNKIVSTGYGRHLAKRFFADEIITEIKAHAIGARYLFPECETVLDIGGQDSKVISLDIKGNVKNFLMNDKCSAGTGKFLEIMSASLGYALSEFGHIALRGSNKIKINSMCTVFAESEVISLKNQGEEPQDIARAVHLSVVERVVGLLYRVGYIDKIVFSGGVANNPCIVQMIEEMLKIKFLIPTSPDIVGALGAALYAEAFKF
ncbi:MAG: acyl-CoA dehydratase activase [Thermodesulfovibrionales bacterium]|nr:acyl-CoA dehydratase activase [Thermodesulfovibrionales bacterium]